MEVQMYQFNVELKNWMGYQGAGHGEGREGQGRGLPGKLITHKGGPLALTPSTLPMPRPLHNPLCSWSMGVQMCQFDIRTWIGGGGWGCYPLAADPYYGLSGQTCLVALGLDQLDPADNIQKMPCWGHINVYIIYTKGLS